MKRAAWRTCGPRRCSSWGLSSGRRTEAGGASRQHVEGAAGRARASQTPSLLGRFKSGDIVNKAAVNILLKLILVLGAHQAGCMFNFGSGAAAPSVLLQQREGPSGSTPSPYWVTLRLSPVVTPRSRPRRQPPLLTCADLLLKPASESRPLTLLCLPPSPEHAFEASPAHVSVASSFQHKGPHAAVHSLLLTGVWLVASFGFTSEAVGNILTCLFADAHFHSSGKTPRVRIAGSQGHTCLTLGETAKPSPRCLSLPRPRRPHLPAPGSPRFSSCERFSVLAGRPKDAL